MANKIAAVYGSPGSGKTVTTVKIAKALAERKQNVIIVSPDDSVPLIPLLIPEAVDTPSIGELLSADYISQIDVLRHCVPYGKSQYISMLGYCRGENFMSYPDYSLQRATELLNNLRCFDDDFILIDCTSDVSNFLTAAALRQADVTFRIVNANPKSWLYFKSTSSLLLRDSGYRYKEQINVLNNVSLWQDTGLAAEAVGNIRYVLPSVPELTEQSEAASLLDTVFSKASRKYTSVINKLVMEVLIHEQERRPVRSRKAANNVL
jgi:MinD-like ATPase involved in chromosome partitioning or flagellar assembly